MAKIILCTDSTCDLSQELVKKYNIDVIPLLISFGTDEYKDGIDMTEDKLYEEVEKRNMLPHTAALSPGFYCDYFTNLVGNENNDVIYIGIGAKLSSNYQSTLLAKQAMDEDKAKHLYIIDSGSLSTGTGLLLLKAGRYIQEGLSCEEIVEKITPLVPCVRAQFSVKTLEYLHKGGRCSALERYLGMLMRIRPILRVIDGKINSETKAFGRYNKALDLQIEDLVSNIDNIDLENVFITHSMADEEAKYIKENLPKSVKDKIQNLYETKAGSVISSHCGKGTIGILYIKKDKVEQ